MAIHASLIHPQPSTHPTGNRAPRWPGRQPAGHPVHRASRWRRSSGHSFADYSLVAKESLVHRVCKEDKSLASSGLQVGLIETLGRDMRDDKMCRLAG